MRRRSPTDDIDVAKTYVWNTVDATVTVNAGIEMETDIAVTSGANMDNWGNNEQAIVRVRREANHANDSMAGNSELWTLLGRET